MQDQARRTLWMVIILGLAAIPVAAATKIVASHHTVRPVVAIGAAGFSPQTLRVPRGTAVLFLNEDPAPHRVIAGDGSFDSGIIGPGKSFQVVVSRSVAYRCEIDPRMTGRIIAS